MSFPNKMKLSEPKAFPVSMYVRVSAVIGVALIAWTTFMYHPSKQIVRGRGPSGFIDMKDSTILSDNSVEITSNVHTTNLEISSSLKENNHLIIQKKNKEENEEITINIVYRSAEEFIRKYSELPSTLSPTCTRLSSQCKLVTSVQHCWVGYNGYFLVNLTSQNPSIRGRVVGAAIQELQVHKLSDHSYGLFYFLPYGIYRAHIRLEFISYNPEDFLYTPPINEAIIKNFQFLNPGMCPFGISKIPGYWLSPSEELSGRMSAPWLQGPQPKITLDSTNLEYIPRDCGLISRRAADQCRAGKRPWKQPLRVCLFGDSQMRHLHNALETLLFPTEYFKYKNSDTDKHIRRSSFLTFIVDDWGTCFRHGPCSVNITQLSCTTILINFGHWQAGYPQGFAHTPIEYETEVKVAITTARKLLYPKKVLWMTTHPFGEMSTLYSNPPQDWRSHSVLKDYNDRAVNICKNLSINYIDIYNIASAVNDLTYDGKHYKLPVGREIGKLVFHELCAESSFNFK